MAEKKGASDAQRNWLRYNFETTSSAASHLKPFESSKSYQDTEAALKAMSERTSGKLSATTDTLPISEAKGATAGEFISGTKAVKSDLVFLNPPIELSRAMRFNASEAQRNWLQGNLETISGAFSQMKPFESSKSYQEIQAALKAMSEGTSGKLSAATHGLPNSEAYVIGDVEIAAGEKTLLGVPRITVPVEPKA